jgi:hypothetical protein
MFAASPKLARKHCCLRSLLFRPSHLAMTLRCTLILLANQSAVLDIAVSLLTSTAEDDRVRISANTTRFSG